ncbi:MAG: ParB/RepB/Spo0J family partition protein [Deltaproteobacteria bacterium]
MEKRALGRGLSALIASSTSVENVLRKEIPVEPRPDAAAQGAPEGPAVPGVGYVELARLSPNRFQPRKQMDDAQLKSLADSIKEKGVLAPILVRRRADGDFEIIAGERRFRAAQLLKLGRVPVVVRDVSDQEALVLSIIENIQREELNPIEEACAFDRLMREFRLTQDEVARSVSKDRSTVANMLRLLTLPQEVQRAISSGQLSFGHGKALLSLESVPQQIRLTQMVLSNSLSVRELEAQIAHARPPKRAGSRTAQAKDPHVVDIEKRLQHCLGTRVKVFEGKKRGRIQIEYFSPQDRERILSFLLRKA